MQEDKLTKRHKDIVRFIIIARLFDFQYPTFYKELKQEMKRRMNLFSASLNQILSLLRTNLPPEYEEYLDNTAAGAWEVLEEYEKAPDKTMFLAVCRAYNAGGIKSETEDIAVNEPEYKDYLKTKKAAA